MLELINKTGDIKSIPENRLDELAEELRRFMVETISETGGHLASNLGVVELTIALHRVYDLPKDRLIWDVGHQTYTHKILTGRKEEFHTLRKEGGLSGFPKRKENEADCFDTGHSSTSISAGLGYVAARDLKKEDYSVVSVIGDGAFTGGMAFEAMNNAASLKTNFVIVLNDNEMSINRNVGGISEYLGRVRTSGAYTGLKMTVSGKLERIPRFGSKTINAIRKTKSSIKQFVIPGMFFEDMGVTYLGPVNGHNIHQMESVLREAKSFPGAVLVHVITEKGRGYAPARKNPTAFHGVSAFRLDEGYKKEEQKGSFTQAFSDEIVELARDNRSICAVTAAMKDGTGLRRFESLYPERFFDVGIAEEHAVTFAAGLSLGGMTPVVAVYSSFLQRAFDQILMDVCAQNLPVVFAIDRSGFVGTDGSTHQGCFDLSYLGMMPNMTILSPKDTEELKAMLRFAVSSKGPVAIRYSKEKPSSITCADDPIEMGKAQILKKGCGLMIWTEGSLAKTGLDLCSLLEMKGITPTLVNARFIKPFDTELFDELSKDHSAVMTIEENVCAGGFGSAVLQYAAERHQNLRIKNCAVSDRFVDHAGISSQRKKEGLDAEHLLAQAEKLCGSDDPGEV